MPEREMNIVEVELILTGGKTNLYPFEEVGVFEDVLKSLERIGWIRVCISYSCLNIDLVGDHTPPAQPSVASLNRQYSTQLMR